MQGATMDKHAACPSPRRMTVSGNLLRLAVRRAGLARIERLCTALSALRSCQGHIGTAFRQGNCFLETGPAWFPNGEPNKRTLARNSGIENMLATYPWADTLDLQMFLAGFDAGEEFAFRNDMQPNRPGPVSEG